MSSDSITSEGKQHHDKTRRVEFPLDTARLMKYSNGHIKSKQRLKLKVKLRVIEGNRLVLISVK